MHAGSLVVDSLDEKFCFAICCCKIVNPSFTASEHHTLPIAKQIAGTCGTHLLLIDFDSQARGGRGLLPENTIPAMLHAVDLGVTTLEMNAVITKDSMVIVSHEPFFNHEITTKPDGSYVTEEERSLNIYEMTYAQVQQFDVGVKPHPRFPEQQKIRCTKPSLSDLIDRVERYQQQHALRPVFL